MNVKKATFVFIFYDLCESRGENKFANLTWCLFRQIASVAHANDRFILIPLCLRHLPSKGKSVLINFCIQLKDTKYHLKFFPFLRENGEAKRVKKLKINFFSLYISTFCSLLVCGLSPCSHLLIIPNKKLNDRSQWLNITWKKKKLTGGEAANQPLPVNTNYCRLCEEE